MKVIKPSVELLTSVSDDFLSAIERAGRVCYKTEYKIEPGTWYCPDCDLYLAPEEVTYEECHNACSADAEWIEDSAVKFVKKLIDRGHHAMLEHAPSISIKFICDRGVSHEIVRHRLFSFAQESTRYCNYGGDDVVFILPCWISAGDQQFLVGNSPMSKSRWCDCYDQPTSKEVDLWVEAMLTSEEIYQKMINCGWKPQQARSVLPNSLKTEIVVTGNVREWRHFFKLRAAKDAHPQMQEVANMALSLVREKVSVLFDDI